MCKRCLKYLPVVAQFAYISKQNERTNGYTVPPSTRGHRYKTGFTLVELLVVMGILTVLLVITIIAVNPFVQLNKAKATQRASDVSNISKAVQQWLIDNNGSLPPSLNGTPYPTAAPGYEIASDSINICAALAPQYIAQLPRDPDIGGGTVSDCAATYHTAYFIYKHPTQNRATVYGSAALAAAITTTPSPSAVPSPTPTLSSWGYDLRFNGNGTGDIDRVKISIDPPTAIDVGASDLTIEFWLKAALAENTSSACLSGGDNWINGNIIIDRDVFGNGDYGDFGVSLYGGKIAFGVANTTAGATICASTTVADDLWHHIAVTRRRSDGLMTVFVDGAQDAQTTGPGGDVSYHDSRATAYPNSDPYFVIGAEKHDYDPVNYPSLKGQIDELRISDSLRYTGGFTRPSAPFASDGSTKALYHFDEGSGTSATDASGNGVTGTIKVGGSPTGPLYFVSTVP